MDMATNVKEDKEIVEVKQEYSDDFIVKDDVETSFALGNVKVEAIIKEEPIEDVAVKLEPEYSFFENDTQIVSSKVKHNRVKNRIPLFSCQYCPYKGSEKGNLKKHMSRMHTDPDKIEWFECAQCDYKGKTKGNLTKHIFHRHTEPHKIQWQYCSRCVFRTKSKSNLRDHELFKHTKPDEIKWFCCDQCSYKGKTKRSLELHKGNIHTWDDKILIGCKFCKLKMKYRTQLRRHMLEKHS